MERYTNELSKETSPYLLQHAHNPVNWVPWTDNVFNEAEKSNKLVLVSIGYSSCHWCHVMERESFEDEEVAAIMNKHFINVKVDREERPDVDNVYMTAVQLMTQRGGWPLNCITLPDGRPIYGGTYFPKEQWIHLLKSLVHTYKNDKEKVVEYAEKLHEGVVASDLITNPKELDQFKTEKLDELIRRWSNNFDKISGGGTRAPKFPLPNNYSFLLDYALKTNNDELKAYVDLSLRKMAQGGIFDQVGGGFSRYSVDMLWKVPHFEKMLYDNAQLIDLYSTAFKVFKDPTFKEVVYRTVNWLQREMLDKSGAYFSALDADSEGEEGKFYVWTEEELKDVLGEDYDWVEEYYQIGTLAHWEEGKQILMRIDSDSEFAKKHNWSTRELSDNVERVIEDLLTHRNYRVRPGIDTKCLTAWNAMLIKGMCNAALTFEEEEFEHCALQTAKWLVHNQTRKDHSLWRTCTNGKSQIDGFLDDYAHVIDACISLYQLTFDEDWIKRAEQYLKFAMNHFHDQKSGMFFYTDQDTKLIARKMEINDNVIPSSNSVMANNLFYLSRYFQNEEYKNIAEQMLANVYEGMEMYGSGYSNWAQLLTNIAVEFSECVVVGSDRSVIRQLQRSVGNNTIFAFSNSTSDLPIFHDKEHTGETLIHVCNEGYCSAPTNSVKEAIQELMK